MLGSLNFLMFLNNGFNVCSNHSKKQVDRVFPDFCFSSGFGEGEVRQIHRENSVGFQEWLALIPAGTGVVGDFPAFRCTSSR